MTARVTREVTVEERQQRNELIFDLWLAGWTERGIAEKLSLTQPAIHKALSLITTAKLEGSYQIEKPPIYNVWNYAKCDPRFGLTQDQIADALKVPQPTICKWLKKANNGTSNNLNKYTPIIQSVKSADIHNSITLYPCRYEEVGDGIPGERNGFIFNHWLAGETTTEIAKKSHLHRTAIDKIIRHATKSRLEGSSITDSPPIYNVWNYATCDPRFGQDYPGRIPGQIAQEVGLDRHSVRNIITTFFTDEKTSNPPDSLQIYNLWEFAQTAIATTTAKRWELEASVPEVKKVPQKSAEPVKPSSQFVVGLKCRLFQD